MRVYLGFPVGLERVLEEKENLLVPARGGGRKRTLPHLWGTIHVGKTKVFILDLERALLKKKPGGKNLEVGPEVGMAWYADVSGKTDSQI